MADSSEKSDNGPVGDTKNAPIRRKVTRATTKDATVLAKELEEENKLNSTLRSKLRKVRSDKKQLEQSFSEGSFVRLHSTMHEENSASEQNSVLMTSMSNLSFASLQVPECKPSEGEEDIDRKTYEQWKELLEASMQLAGVSDEITKMNIFKIKAGLKLLDILEGTVSNANSPDVRTVPYSNAIHRLDSFFGSRDYLFMQRQKLRALAQKTGETDSKYVKRVIAVAKLCDFDEAVLIEQVADAIQAHASNYKVREVARKFLRKGGQVGELLDKVRTLEMDQINEEMYAKNHQPAAQQAQVAAVATEKPKNEQFNNNRFGSQRYLRNDQPRFGTNWRGARGRGFVRRGYVGGTTSRASSQQDRCWRCLSNRHNASECWSIQQTCHNCQRMGHVARACRRMPSAGPMKRRVSNDDKEVASTSKKVAIVKQDEEDAMNDDKYVPQFKTSDSTSKFNQPECALEARAASIACSSDYDQNLIENRNALTEQDKCISGVNESLNWDKSGVIVGKIAGTPVSFLIDSGADVNTIGSDTFELLLISDKSRAGLLCINHGTDKPLKAYASSGQIDVVATFVAELTLTDDRPCYMEKFYVIDRARALLGRDTAIRYSVLQLGLSVPISTEYQVNYPGEIHSLNEPEEFPRFNVPPVILRYDDTMPPSRKIFTNIPPAFKAEAERRINDLLASGIIERVTDSMTKSYCSSLLVVPKGKNDIRLVVDLRGPNQAIVRTPFKMPTLESILSDLPDCKWFSTIDLKSAFFHVVLDENSRHLTNFFAGNAMYRFQRLPFGLTNAPDIFQEIMQTIVLAGCKGTRNYLDDILVSGRTKKEHDDNLEEVLRRLREHNVCINDEKCVFGKQSVKFIGFQLGHDGLRVEEEKLKAIRSFRKPETQQEVKSFLGLMNFTERFIPNRADKTKKLRELAKSEHFYWSEEEEAEFAFLKEEALNTISKLGYFNVDDDTELYVDASPFGLGAVLAQYNNEGVPRVISCASKALTAAEMRYPQTQKEALAMVWGIERFTFYLTGKSFVVRTDSEANEFIFGKGYKSSKRAVSRAESWALRLQAYDFKVKRIPGLLNIADALSRLISKAQVDEPFEEEDEKNLLYSLEAGYMNITWQDIELESEKDDNLAEVRTAIKSGHWPRHLMGYEAQLRDLRLFGPMLFKEDKIVLPLSLHLKAIEEAHKGHIGCPAMKRILRDYFWWPGISGDVEKFVRKCNACVVISKRNPPIPLSSRQLPEGPWEILQVDFLTVHGCGFGEFMVLVDTYSRFLSVVEMRSTDARSTNEALQKIFFTWGLPLILQSDNGPPFQSTEFVRFWEAKGVTVRKSIPLCPQTNGSVERQNQGVIKALSAAKIDGNNWRNALQEYVHVHNTLKPHARLGITPFELLVGWKHRGTFPSLWDSKSEDTLDREYVRDMDATTKLQSKKYADARRGAKVSDISAGDIVLMAKSKKKKTDPLFSNERFTVLSRDGAKVVVRSNRGVQYTRSVNDLKRAPFNSRDTEDEVPNSDEEADNIAEEEHLGDVEGPVAKVTRPVRNEEHQGDVEGPVEKVNRPVRNVRKPERFKDMCLYNIFQ